MNVQKIVSKGLMAAAISGALAAVPMDDVRAQVQLPGMN